MRLITVRDWCFIRKGVYLIGEMNRSITSITGLNTLTEHCRHKLAVDTTVLVDLLSNGEGASHQSSQRTKFINFN
jgi:hypothetical protein